MTDLLALVADFSAIADRATAQADAARADAARWRSMLQAALDVAAKQTARAEQAEAVGRMLRQDIRWRGTVFPSEECSE